MSRKRPVRMGRALLVAGLSATVLLAILMWAFGVRPVHLQLLLHRPMELSAEQEAEVHAWLRDHAIRLKTLDAGSGFEDMQPLKKVFGDAGIVALGEQAHVNRDFHRANHRMIEFLVSEMGFTVFAIEANFGGALAINDYVIEGKGDPERALAALEYPAWNTEIFLEMVRWMRDYNATHEKKIRFYGVDDKPASVSAQAVHHYLRKTNGSRDYDELLSITMNPWTAERLNGGPKEKLLSAIEQVKGLIAYLESRKPVHGQGNQPEPDLEEQKEWSLVVQHARVLLQNLEFRHLTPAASEASSLRDRHMAENARWIRNHEDGAKMILWAANPHISAIPGPGSSMGGHLRQTYGDDLVVMGLIRNRWFKSAGGDSPLARSDGMPPVKEGTLPGVLTKAGLDMAVVDFRSLPRGIVSRYFHSPLETGGALTILPKAFDAVLFIESTSAARIIMKDGLGNDETLSTPSNLDFEEATEGTPKDWRIHGRRSLLQYETTVSDEDAYRGNASCVIRKAAGYCFGETYAGIHQEIWAGDFSGDRIQLKAAARVNDGIAHLWLRVGVRNGPDVFRQVEITSDQWQEYRISADVPPNASKIRYGLAYFGNGAAFLDDVSIERSDQGPMS